MRSHNHTPRDFFNYPDMNDFCYMACMDHAPEKLKFVTRDQHCFFSSNAILWNTENLHENASTDLPKIGGTDKNKIHVRHKTNEINYKKQLSNEVIDMLTTKYAKDFELWEKAYAVYN